MSANTEENGSFHSMKRGISTFINYARKPQALKPGDEWHPGAKLRPVILMA
jgi:hypothetical protein